MIPALNNQSSFAARYLGFTLIEMLMAMAVVTILAGMMMALIPMGISKARKDRASVDMTVIQGGLEAYRARFGDYPRYPASVDTDDAKSAYLLNALAGRYGPTGDPINVASMLNLGLLEFEEVNLPINSVQDNRIIDPWGMPYIYDDEPKDAADKKLFGYFLYSYGPDKAAGGGDDIYAK